jgi:hypothetical protein
MADIRTARPTAYPTLGQHSIPPSLLLRADQVIE